MVCAPLPHTSPDKPLLGEIERVIGRVADFKDRAREYYFAVILSPHQCPQCRGRLRMTGRSECSCSCGNIFDPTLAFQRAHCCGARLLRKTFHYTCSGCNRTVPSRFLFDERIFDRAYFREMMRESRERAKEKREEVRRLLAESRSGVLLLMDDPDIESIPGLIQDLDEFIGQQRIEADESVFDTTGGFRIEHYREHILSILSWDNVLFSDIVPLAEDGRRDRTWRFITLVFMENDREVDLVQHGDDLVVQRVYNEAHA